VGSLIRFVEAKVSATPAAATVTTAPAAVDLLSQLPHRDPFRFISKLSKVEPGIAGEAVWSVSGKEAFFAGHFPGNPLVPGVLIAEALAQLSGLVGASADATAPRLGKLAQVDVRFLAAIVPPAEIVLQSKVLGALGALRQFEVTALVKGTPMAQGKVTIAYEAAAEARK
jgi:3-hydroxyacyl-[acyl-carrier-protein] dehydratase